MESTCKTPTSRPGSGRARTRYQPDGTREELGRCVVVTERSIAVPGVSMRRHIWDCRVVLESRKALIRCGHLGRRLMSASVWATQRRDGDVMLCTSRQAHRREEITPRALDHTTYNNRLQSAKPLVSGRRATVHGLELTPHQSSQPARGLSSAASCHEPAAYCGHRSLRSLSRPHHKGR